MENQFRKTSAISLLIGSFLLIVTMVLHPSGGSLNHILKISRVIVSAHSLAIISLPFVGFGFYGLSIALLTKNKLSMLAFIIICQGLIAAMLAATINGLTLPWFLANYANDLETNRQILIPIVKYGFAINQPMDYIFIGASSAAIGIWSVLMIVSDKFPNWLGFYGILLVLGGLIGIVVQFNFIDLFGFRIYVFGLASWIVLVSAWLLIVKEKIS
jgi:hypothetical protein